MWRDKKDVRKEEDMVKEDESECETDNWLSQNQNPTCLRGTHARSWLTSQSKHSKKLPILCIDIIGISRVPCRVL